MLTDPALIIPLLSCMEIASVLVVKYRKLERPIMIIRLCLSSAVLALAFSLIFKALIGRARPQFDSELNPFILIPFSGSHLYESLPSAQAATISAICCCIALRFPSSRLFVASLAFLITLSRVIVERHWLSDVLAGWIVGGVATFISALLLNSLLDFGKRQR
ncbi:phosphatase PAP2 family protein [Sulfitobacter sp. 20_GPM-1509m]|uniref:phosphatase PAP2 family protein n=1 Tax=Sulfitobacter sp. 20_GPM-1509m TaxID=1380367 RepID=UPI0034A0B191